MYVSYVRGIPTTWECPRTILHYISENLWDWKLEGPLSTLLRPGDRRLRGTFTGWDVENVV